VPGHEQRTCRRNELHLHVARVHGDALKQSRGCRGRNREHAVRARHRSAPDVQRRRDDPLRPELLQAVHRADDIDDGVDGADFVEVDAVDRHVVNGGFRLGQPLEQMDRAFFPRLR